MPLRKNPHGGHLCLTVNDYINARAAKLATQATTAQSHKDVTANMLARQIARFLGPRSIQDTGAVTNVMSTPQMRTSLDSWNSIIQNSTPDSEPDSSQHELLRHESLPALESVSGIHTHGQASNESESNRDAPDDEPGSHEQELSSSDSLPELVPRERTRAGSSDEESEDSEFELTSPELISESS